MALNSRRIHLFFQNRNPDIRGICNRKSNSGPDYVSSISQIKIRLVPLGFFQVLFEFRAIRNVVMYFKSFFQDDLQNCHFSPWQLIFELNWYVLKSFSPIYVHLSLVYLWHKNKRTLIYCTKISISYSIADFSTLKIVCVLHSLILVSRINLWQGNNKIHTLLSICVLTYIYSACL